MRPTPFAAILLAWAACATEPLGGRAAVTVTPIAGPVALDSDESRAEWLCVVRVVDAMTGAPIPGARVHCAAEADRPRGGVFTPDHTWVGDREGFVRISPKPERGGWFYVEAAGYGPIADMNHLPTDRAIALMPGIDVPVRVLDPFDRPVVDGRLGLCLGCGHTPDVRTTRTDADGRAVLRGIEPVTGFTDGDAEIRDLYLDASGLSCIYEDADWQLGDGPVVRHAAFVPDVRGRILGPTGAPIPGVALGGTLHRGPWTWTAADGTFCLRGRQSRDDTVQVRFDGREYTLLPPATDRPIDVIFPVEQLPAERPLASIAVRALDEDTGAPLSDVVVTAWLPGLIHADDASVVGHTDAAGACTVTVPAGCVDLLVEMGSGVPTHDPCLRTLAVRADSPTHVEVRLAPRRPLPVVVNGAWRDVTLLTATDETSLGDEIRAGSPVPLPRRQPFVLVLEPEDGPTRRFPFAQLPEGPIELRPFAPTAVHLRVLAEHGQPVAARVAIGHDATPPAPESDDAGWLATDANGCAVVPTLLAGCAFVHVAPTGPDLRARSLHVALPPLGDAVEHALGAVALPATARPPLRILQADGTPAGGELTLLRPGLRLGQALAADGGYDGPGLVDGVRLRLAAPDRRTVEWTWRGEATLRLPTNPASLAIEVADPFGLRPRGVAAWLGGARIDGDATGLHLEHLPAGPLELLVGAEGCDSARLRLTLADGEARTLRITLPRR